MARKKMETKPTKKETKPTKSTKKAPTKSKKKNIVSTQNEDIEQIIRYLKSEPTPENYAKYVSPLVEAKGRKYADKLIGSTIIVLKERGLTLNDITFDKDNNLTVIVPEKE